MKIRTGILESDKIYHCLFRLMSGSPRHVVNFRRLNISIPKIKTITPKQEKSGMQLPNLRSSCVNRPSAINMTLNLFNQQPIYFFTWKKKLFTSLEDIFGFTALCYKQILILNICIKTFTNLIWYLIEIKISFVFYILGCDSGFGHSLALNLDRQGFTVFAGCLFSDREGARSLKENSKNIQVVQLDVTDDWQVRKAVQTVKENLNGKGESSGESN